MILNLDTGYFDNCVEVILYPGAFCVNREQTDAIRLVHSDARVLSGESWLRGPVILSRDDVERDSYRQVGSNVVLHEFAHKLDGLHGITNGLPPLRRGMSRKRWDQTMSCAYDAMCIQVAAGEPPCINPYAATNPAEFFAVVTEYFFSAPEILNNCYSEVHQQLELFYQQPTLR